MSGHNGWKLRGVVLRNIHGFVRTATARGYWLISINHTDLKVYEDDVTKANLTTLFEGQELYFDVAESAHKGRHAVNLGAAPVIGSR